MCVVANSQLPVPADAVLVDDLAKKVNIVTVELPLLQLDIKVVFPKSVEDLHHVLTMFGLVPGIDEDIINIDNDEMMK